MYHLRRIKSLVLTLLVCTAAHAQIESGNVYRFVNVGKSDRSMAIGNLNNVVASTTTDANDYAQLWYAESNGSGFTLRNLANGRYLYSPNATSGAWLTSKEVNTDNSVFTATSVGDNYAIAVSGKGGYNYMHADGSNNIVCWESSNANSQWTMNVVDIDAATLNAKWDELASIDPSDATIGTYQSALDNLFSDKACTTLKKSFANENAVKNDADYKALPTTLQEMVLKVYKDSWAEDNYDGSKLAWGADYAKKYRVQLYEPYNEPEAAASALGLNAHTNLNNPTGIFANDHEALYVMVEGEIETGASLYLVSYTGNGELYGYNDGYELKQGLNIIPSFGDGNNYCINYVVHTFDTSKGKGNKAKAYRLSDFDDLKIHIEGGYINGYYNKMGDELYLGADGNQGDKAADWDYVEARATQTTVTILGEYITLQFPLNDAVDSDGATQKGMSYYLDQVSVENVIDEWDKVMLWERLVLGLLDEETTKDEAKKSPYSDKDYVFEYTGTDNDGFESGYEDYYNIHGLSLGIPNSYMYGGWRHCGYNYGTMQDIMVNMLTSAGSHWGPGHEIGHQHQNLLTVNGLTEVTNNLFANVVLWYFGESTSRYNGSDGALSNVLAAFNTEGSDFFTNNIWALTHMYYKLFLYYHVLGHNTKFYPTLFEMLRQDPMSGGYEQNGATSLLHFYKKCCLASGDDLTEFFRAHGFFSVMDNRLVGDYSNSVYTTTQADIDAAIMEVKDLGYDENIAVLFINDATGETIESHKGDNLDLYGETTVCAEVGGYASFNANTTPDYTYSVSGTTVTMEGTGGTGFAIFNEKGEIIAFSDTKTFEVSSECAVAIASGKAEIKAVQADNTIIEAVDVMDTDNAEAKYEALGELLTATADLLTYADADNSKPGFYRASVMETLQQLYDEAQSVYDNKEVASYATTYAALAQEYTRIAALDTDKTPFLPGSTYVLTNKKYPNVSMALSNNALIASATDMSNSAQQWTFEATDEADIYYLKNGSNYLGSLLQSTQVGVTTQELASRYKLFDLGKGLWALQCQNDLEKLMSLHCNSSYKIVGWTHTATDNDGSWWYLTATAKDESMLPLYDLQNLIAKTEALVDEIATVQGKGTAVELSAENITSNATETGHETKYLLDGNAATYFHTVWASSSVNEPHYLQVDLGEAKSLSEFVWTYTTYTTDWNADLPTTVKVTGSADNQLWNDIATLTDLPSTKGTDYKSATLGSSNQNFRYLRFTATATSTSGKINNQYYFGLGEMGLTRMSTLVEAIGDKYQNFITADALKAACDQVYAAQQTYASGSATTDDVDALQAQYDILLAAYENANNVEFNAKKEELLTLIENTTSLISTCGTIRVIEGGALTLSTTSGADVNYLSGTAKATGEGGLSNLYDNEVSTSYTSDWSDTPSTHPYLQVTLPDGQELGKFTFTFTGRNSGNAPTPSTIVVSGSNNGSTFTEIETFTKDGTWPVAANNQTITPRTWTSPTITTTTAYKYLRFTVTAAERSSGAVNNSNGYCHYGISEFGVSRVGETIVTLSGEHGDADEALLLATYQAVQEAEAIGNRATTGAQLQSAINDLAVAKEALYNAMYSSVEYTITANILGGGVTFEGGEPCVGGGTLSVPASLTPDELKANLAAIDVNGYVAKSITINGSEISIIYNKEYIVTITGGEGEGRVTFGDDEYANDGTFDAEQDSFTAADLQATDVEGYTKSAVTVNHETGAISVTYALDKSKLNDLLGDTHTLIYACDGFVNSEFVTAALLEETYAAWITAQNALETVQTRSELNDALNDLQTAHDKLDAAKTSAEQEAAERTELNGQLSTLIAETETLIASCYENDVLKYVNSVFVTKESLEAVRTLIAEADAKCDNKGTTANEYNTSITALSQAKSDLTAAIENAEAEAALPVDLTIDANTPKLYVIKTKRGGNPVLQYESKSGLFGVTTAVEKEAAQAFYFMAGNKTAEGTLQVYIYPYLADGMVLAANDVTDGKEKALAMDKGTAPYELWVFVEQADGYYNLQPAGTSTYLSNYGGEGNKMGFYRYSPDTDMGSLFKFESTTVEGGYYYLKLKDYYENQTKVASSEIQGGTAIGCYPVTEANAYNTAYAAAREALANTATTDDEYQTAYTNLVAADEALELIMPEVGKYYTIVSACDDNNRNGQLMYATGENEMKFANDKAGTDADGSWIRPEALWTFTKEGYMMNLQTGCHVGTSTWGGALTLVEDDAKVVSIEPLATLNGQVLLKPGGGYPLHAQASGSKIVGYSNENNASAWYIVEVKDMSQVKHLVSITQYEHAGLYLNYPVTIPDEVKVYYIDGSNIEIDGDGVGTLTLTKLEGDVLPAWTAVILYAPAGNYSLAYTDEEAIVSDNLLKGSAYLTYKAAVTGHHYYVFGQNDGEVGLYKNGVKYDAEGAEGTTHYRMSANKVLFDWGNIELKAASFRFRFNSPTTDIENIVLEGSLIYDLYGRRILDVKVSGLYIVDGVKRYIEVK